MKVLLKNTFSIANTLSNMQSKLNYSYQKCRSFHIPYNIYVQVIQLHQVLRICEGDHCHGSLSLNTVHKSIQVVYFVEKETWNADIS